MNKSSLDSIQEFAGFCIESHNRINQKYANRPYSYHLEGVVKFAKKFLFLLPKSCHEDVLKIAWGHDLLEDTLVTYNKLLKVTNEDVAEAIFCLTDEKGRNRKERKNKKFYKELRKNELAVYIKICDRIANVSHGRENSTKHYKMYFKEHKEFKKKLYVFEKFNIFQKTKNLFIKPKSKFDDMWKFLEKLQTN